MLTKSQHLYTFGGEGHRTLGGITSCPVGFRSSVVVGGVWGDIVSDLLYLNLLLFQTPDSRCHVAFQHGVSSTSLGST